MIPALRAGSMDLTWTEFYHKSGSVTMNPRDMHAFQWQRIFFGTLPPVYLGEVVVRNAIVSALVAIILKLPGKRMSGEMSVLEKAIMPEQDEKIHLVYQVPDASSLVCRNCGPSNSQAIEKAREEKLS